MSIDPNLIKYVKGQRLIDGLVGAGPAATSNLFKAYFFFENLPTGDLDEVVNQLSFKVNTFTTPERKAALLDLPILDTYFKIAAPGHTSLSKTQNVSIRIDENYNNYAFLQEQCCIDSDGTFKKNSSRKCNIIITALKSSLAKSTRADSLEELPNLVPTYSWQFSDCYITGIDSLSYAYGSANIQNAVVNFVYKSYKEGSITAAEMKNMYLNYNS